MFDINNEPGLTVDPFSTCVTPLELCSDKHSVGHGTGFFWKHDEVVYLVTNWHVLTGRNPKDHQPLNKHGLIPNRIVYNTFWGSNLNSYHHVEQAVVDAAGSSLFFEHPQLHSAIDVAVLQLDPEAKMVGHPVPPVNSTVHCINEFPLNDTIPVDVGSDVFALGFPLGLRKTGPFPIWKRGSVASEYIFNVERLPCFLIDTATREGMSGSPVVLRRRPNPRIIGLNTWEPAQTRLLGVYSGRYTRDEMEAQLGIVWRSSAVEEVLLSKRIARHRFS